MLTRIFLFCILASIGAYAPVIAQTFGPPRPTMSGGGGAAAYPDTPQRPSLEGNASGARVGAILNPLIPVGATLLNNSVNVNTAVTNAPAGTTFVFAAQLYHGVQITPKAGDVFIGLPGTVFSGAFTLTGFTGLAGAYVVNAPQGVNPANGGGSCYNSGDPGPAPGPYFPRCTYPYDVFYDGKPLTAVASLTGFATGQFYYNLGAGTITIFDNPSGHTVETSVTPWTFDSTNVSNVTLENLIITKYDSVFQQGCVGSTGGAGAATGWRVINVEISLCHGDGIRLPSGSVIQNSYVHDIGGLGIGEGATNNIAILNNEISFNNYAGYDCQNECGGIKSGQGYNFRIVGNNVHDGVVYGTPGIWADADSHDWEVAYNITHDNPGQGTSFEESCWMTYHDNLSYMDGKNTQSGSWTGGLTFAATHDMQAYSNTISGYGGIVGPQQHRVDVGTYCGNPHYIYNIRVHDNVISMIVSNFGINGQWCDGSLGTGSVDCQTAMNTTNSQWYANVYRMTSNASMFTWTGGGQSSGNITFSQFQAIPQDAAAPSMLAIIPFAPNFP